MIKARPSQFLPLFIRGRYCEHLPIALLFLFKINEVKNERFSAILFPVDAQDVQNCAHDFYCHIDVIR